MNINSISTREQLEAMVPEGTKLDLKVLKILEPNDAWIEEHPTIKGHKYIPIGIIEDLLDVFFGDDWDIDVTAFRGPQDVAVKAIITAEYPSNGRKRVLSGISGIQVNAVNTIESCYQIAKSLAIKDAADHFGPIFGRNLNRDKPEQLPVKQTARDIADSKNRTTVIDSIEACTSVQQLDMLKNHAAKLGVMAIFNDKLEKIENKP